MQVDHLSLSIHQQSQIKNETVFLNNQRVRYMVSKIIHLVSIDSPAECLVRQNPDRIFGQPKKLLT